MKTRTILLIGLLCLFIFSCTKQELPVKETGHLKSSLEPHPFSTAFLQKYTAQTIQSLLERHYQVPINSITIEADTVKDVFETDQYHKVFVNFDGKKTWIGISITGTNFNRDVQEVTITGYECISDECTNCGEPYYTGYPGWAWDCARCEVYPYPLNCSIGFFTNENVICYE